MHPAKRSLFTIKMSVLEYLFLNFSMTKDMIIFIYFLVVLKNLWWQDLSSFVKEKKCHSKCQRLKNRKRILSLKGQIFNKIQIKVKFRLIKGKLKNKINGIHLNKNTTDNFNKQEYKYKLISLCVLIRFKLKFL